MKAQLVHVDAFTGAPFKGNPAMVCILPAERSCSPSSEWCQALAADINLSETVFLRPLGSESSSDYQIRWFTPFAEVDLCGHATLAAAHAVFESHGTEKKMSSLSFDSASGVLTIERAGDMLWMNFPRIHTVGVPESAELHNTVAAALGILAGEISFLGRTTSDVLFVVVQSEEAVRSLSPDFRLMSALPRHHGVLATSEADVKTKADFVSRYFAPTLGIDEDPVTGSAHCSLAPYWSERLGKLDTVGLQCSRRQGAVQCHLRGDRVHLGGQAVSIYRGEISLLVGLGTAE